MKKLIIVLCCFTSIYASAQTTLTLTTAHFYGMGECILPTFDNMLQLLQAKDHNFDATMKKYGYAPATFQENQGLFRGVLGLNRGKDSVSGKTRIRMFVGKIMGKTTAYIGALEADIKSRFPNAVYTTYGFTEAFEFALKSKTGSHNYKIDIDKQRLGFDDGIVTLTLIN